MHKTPNNFVKTFDVNKKRICLCKSLFPTFIIGRTFGVYPVTWRHEGGICVFQRSKFWLCWSALMGMIFLVNFYYYAELSVFSTKYDLPIILNGVTDMIYYTYLMIIIFLNNWNAGRWAKVFNELSKIQKFGLLCESAMTTVNSLTIAFNIFYVLLVIFNGSILAYLHYSDTYETDFSFTFVGGKLLQNGILMFYVFFFTMIAVLIGILTCFEKLSLSALKYTEIYPMKQITGSENKQDIFVFFTYKVCKSDHNSAPELQKLPTAEIIEYFRILHEEVSETMYAMNDCLNPLLLIHVVIEIIILVINWYSIIIKMAYEFKSAETENMFVLNLVFAVSHSIGLFVFLRNAQKLSNMVHGYTSFLMEYSTRVSSPADHLQLRIFIEKIKQHKPLTANGIFTIDLGIAGPIFANILTYVLVALQFKIPQAEQ